MYGWLPSRAPLLRSTGLLRRPCQRQILSRYLSDASPTTKSQDNKAFSKTLLLPKTKFPLRLDSKKAEEAYRELTCDKLYQWQWDNSKGPLFVLHDGPPYANGDLHMGHALNKVIKDIINRFHVLLGRRVHYVPGWDCHGLPIENKALKDQKLSPVDTPPTTIRTAARATALREIDSQREQFKPLGIMADWNSKERTYRTLDKHYVIRQLRIFQKMVEKGLIYRQHKPVHYSPSSRSALAEAELVYKDNHVSHSVYVTFNVDKSSIKPGCVLEGHSNVKLLVWTTTPWTLSANMAIAVHEDLVYALVRPRPDVDQTLDQAPTYVVAQERIEALEKALDTQFETLVTFQGSEIVGVTYASIFPDSPYRFKVIPASHVTSDSGTGLVHCAPAHGVEDHVALKDQGLLSPPSSSSEDAASTMLCHVSSTGSFSPLISDVVGPSLAEELVGKSVLGEGNKAMVGILKSLGRVEKVERIKHRYPYDWKTDKPIIVTATSQWFANLDKIKVDALDALKGVSFFPPQSRNRLESFVTSRSEWCISRQRAWGVPIPAIEHVPSATAILDNESIGFIIKRLENDEVEIDDWWADDSTASAWVSPEVKAKFESAASANEDGSPVWKKGRDTMDVWFDSGTSWSMLSEMGVGAGIPSSDGSGLLRAVDADLCLEGSDQHRGWFQSQLLTKIASAPSTATAKPSSPYGGLLTHGMVLDEKGKKMSKSLGNIISPMVIVNGDKSKPAYGSDLLRLWAATVEYWRDMSIGPTVIGQAAESMRKIRNSARFCLGNLGDGRVLKESEKVPKAEMGLAEKYVLHELYTLEQTALEAYASYNFPKVINALNHFTNITLSALYFDITKDCLYADRADSLARRSVETVLDQVLETMTKVMAPVLPYLAEEIHSLRVGDGKSVFMMPWVPLDSQWHDPTAAKEMADLLHVRSDVLALLEKARMAKQIKSSLETEVDVIIPEPEGGEETALVALLRREEGFLKTLFIVSDAVVTDEGSLGTVSPAWVYSEGIDGGIAMRVRPATLEKCPRCWTYTRTPEEDVCGRCAKVI